MVVGACEGHGELQEAQRFVVAAFHGNDIAEVGDGDIGSSAVCCVAVIVGLDQGMLKSGGESHLAAAVESQAGRIDADGGDIASHGSSGTAHGEASSSALVRRLGIKDGVGDTLTPKVESDQG